MDAKRAASLLHEPPRVEVLRAPTTSDRIPEQGRMRAGLVAATRRAGRPLERVMDHSSAAWKPSEHYRGVREQIDRLYLIAREAIGDKPGQGGDRRRCCGPL